MKKLKTLFATVFLATATSTLVYANSHEQQILQLKQGLEAAEKGDFKTAFELWKPLAEQGNDIAQYALGFSYREGEGVQQDYQQAAKWFEKAAEQGLVDAQFSLGNAYYNGRGVQQDYQQAAKWFEKAAEQGNASAQYNLGVMYKNGEGVQQDMAKAKMWIGRACDNGVQDACDAYRELNKGQ